MTPYLFFVAAFLIEEGEYILTKFFLLRYIKAAASPKEIVIMLDTSGSMTGIRKEIAKHTVLTILETLSENDFVAIYKFATHPEVCTYAVSNFLKINIFKKLNIYCFANFLDCFSLFI